MDLSSPLTKAAFSIAKRLTDKGHTAYFAGGCVRDFLMGREPQDFDVATSALPEEVEGIFSRTVPVGKQFGVILVMEGEMTFEVATFRTEGGYQDGRHPTKVSFSGPEEDASRRDFTVNGLFFDPQKSKVIDFVGGEKDLRAKVLRAIGDPDKRFEEDKLRLMRAVRFAASLDFQMDPATWAAVCRRAPEIVCVSPERIRDELVRTLTRPGAARGFQMLSDSGLMKAILPEIEAMKGVAQPPEYHPEGDVFVHTKLLLEKLKEPSATLALAALFHDVAKPVTYTVDDKGRIRFNSHAPIGARMSREIMKRLRFSNEEIDKVCSAVEHHMTFKDTPQMREGKLKLFISRPNFNEELELHRVDCLSASGNLENYEFIRKKLDQYAHEPLRPKPLLSGHDLLALGLKAGPVMKPVLDEAYELQLEKKLLTPEDAKAWALAKVESLKLSPE